MVLPEAAGCGISSDWLESAEPYDFRVRACILYASSAKYKLHLDILRSFSISIFKCKVGSITLILRYWQIQSRVDTHLSELLFFLAEFYV